MEVKTRCPLCDESMGDLYAEHKNNDIQPYQEGYHYWCYQCDHGWYISDLKNIASQNLEYMASRGRCGKSPEQIREIILAKDKEETKEE